MADLEQTLIETVRSLSPTHQEAVLSFARSLSNNIDRIEPLPLSLSLQQIAKLPIQERDRLLAPYIAAMAEDFQTDPELTEFSVLDTEDWED
ncbi:hypothetical protein IQ250_13545 [Pseudanabaenaceae cyanobacterium LEGE 13415]|nr:hypothetical protein [Pseudanabaenaceae cyanobacterium LEGE 13415]